MPSLTASIQPLGPIIQLAALVSTPRSVALKSLGLKPAAPVIFTGLIDTGASCTCIDAAVIRKLGIPPRGVTHIITPSTGSTPHACLQYDIDLAVLLDDNEIHLIRTLPVIETDLGHQGHQALIGRDVLSQATLLYNGRAKEITLTF